MRALRGQALWDTLHQARQNLLDRCERYAQVTIPKVCLPEHVVNNDQSLRLDWSSFGAQAVNHLTNRIVMGLFQPSFPFFRLDMAEEAKQQLLAAGMEEEDLRKAMTRMEQQGLRVMDKQAIRPVLFELARHLVVTGNAVMDLREGVEVRGLRDYVVRRSMKGAIIRIMFRDTVLVDELEEEARRHTSKANDEDKVNFIQEFTKSGDEWEMRQYLDNIELPFDQFGQTWAADEFPIHVLCWDLARGQDYGTGLVEDYSADFGTLNTLTEAEVQLALQLSDYRWMAHPTGMANIDDFKNSRVGDVLPGSATDIGIVGSAQTGQSLQAVAASAAAVMNRLGRAFQVGSAVTRNAERVTAEEIRMVAQELETSFGGVYSRLAVDLQRPLVFWLMREVDMAIEGTVIEPTIVTGLDALSRSAEASNLVWFIQDLAGVVALGDAAKLLNLRNIAATLAQARGLDMDQFVLTKEEMEANAQAEQQAAVQQTAGTELAKAGAQAATQGVV